MRIAAITTTPAGLRALAPLCQKKDQVAYPTKTQGIALNTLDSSISADLWVAERLTDEAQTLGLDFQSYNLTLRDFLSQQWQTYDAFIFCLTTGAVVRLIAPLLQDKTTDPAILVLDESGQYVVSLCGGHQGGADRLTQQVSHYLDTNAVITGAAARLNLPGIDILGEPFGWGKGSGNWTQVSAAIAQFASVQVIQEAGTDLWQQHLPEAHPFQFGFPEFQDRQTVPPPKARVWISPIQRTFAEQADFPKVQWHPRVLWVGIGCERNSPQALIDHAVTQVFAAHHLALDAIAGVATVDLKADEVGLVDLCQEKNWPIRCFSPDRLKSISVPNPSDIVANAVGTPSVAEAAAQLVVRDCAGLNHNLAPLIVSKQILRHPDYPGAVTIAVAQAEREYIGRPGQLLLVGTGPGRLDQITPAAKNAISQADVVIGYSLYIDLIRPLLRPGQIVEPWPITQERQRAERAIELADWGLTVGVVSSGDCGIYGMAGLVLETLKAQQWDGETPAVQVLPGISALQAAASRVGAPLMHDFCAISLSNLLTPWAVIETRLTAVAQADFIVALYNPKSKTRIEQIELAQSIFLQYRSPQTPVALARSLYRPDETITLTTLEDMLTQPIDMLTTVLIGNQSSLTYAGWFITPRGYLGFTMEDSV